MVYVNEDREGAAHALPLSLKAWPPVAGAPSSQ
jgi:hypothetical protein